MNKKHSKFIAAILLTVLSFLVNLEAKDRPNIIFIFADDWGWGDLSCHDHPYVKTPNIDRLAKEGTDFQRFTVASGVCSPSRTAIVTGHFPARYGISGHFAWPNDNARRNMPDWLSPNAPLLPRMLQEAGYATAHYGKWHLANNMIPDSPLASEYGYDEFGTFNSAGEQMPVHDDVRLANKFIEKNHKAGKPFFINLWMHESHTPFHTVPKYRWRFPNLPEKDNIYASVLSHADDRVGELLDTLDRLNISRNTLVIFSSDNGPARASKEGDLKLQHDTATGAGYGINAAKGITGGRRGYKASLFEGGIGVPFLARWPGKIAANTIDNTSLMSAVDILPTFCELANAKLPARYKPDGVSQVTTLLGKAFTERKTPLFWKAMSPWPAQGSKPDHWPAYVIVKDNWKLVANIHNDHVQLFDITKDVNEDNDLKDQHPEVVAKLQKSITKWQKTLPKKPDSTCFSKHRTKK